MKSLLVVALMAAYTICVNAQGCKDVANCDTCANPGPQCWSCLTGNVMAADMKSCLSCGTGCSTCTADASAKITCMMCNKGYYLKAGVCTVCDIGCAECSLMADGATVTCDKCMAEGYAASTVAATKVTTCVACPSKCKTCSVQTDGSTKCSACFSYKGEGKQGAFLKTADKTCSTCPSFCESCTDDGNGVGICKSCYASYVPLVDAADSTKDGTQCLSCHSDCKTCEGTKIGSVATCTECVADKGLYISSGACSICTTGAKTCTTTGEASECLVDYRLDTSSCTACPAFCKECPLDSNSGTTCNACDAMYGTKPSTSKSCDSCGISNCNTCSRSNTGSFSCSACKLGFALVSSTSCGSCPSSCSAANGCSYSGSSYTCTTTCKDATYSSSPSPSGVCSLCSTADANCDTCSFSGSTLQCDTCKTPYHKNATSGGCVVNVSPNSQCKTANSDGSTCTACNDGYSEVLADGTTCNRCTDTVNCILCNQTLPGECKTCKSGYISSDETLGGTCYSCSDASWGSGTVNGIANAKTCAWSGASIVVSTCNDGYLQKTDNTACVSNVDTLNGKCTALVGGSATNCQTCASGYGPVTTLTNCPKCNDGNCNTCLAEASGEKKCTTCKVKYITTDNGGGECKSCPGNCNTCVWDSGNSRTNCVAGQCAQFYKLNPDTGKCDACPDNCAACEWDTATTQIICTANQCKANFGRLESDKTKCNACPANCGACSVSSADGADDTLFCDTCAASHALNSDVCGACPSNCNECTDNKGNMECGACKDKYALDASLKTCVKCPTNCLKCSTSAGTTKCSECSTGYSLSADTLSCTDCGTAAFANCKECTSTDAASGKANCTDCSAGYALQDGEEDTACTDLGSLSCGSGKSGDYPSQCSACSAGFSVTKDLLCAKKCYKCGDMDDGKYVDKAKCTIPAAGGNATENDAEQEDCLSGICVAVSMGGKVAAGCLSSKDTLGVCTGLRASGETCSTANDKTLCEQCCTTELCNSFVTLLDGIPDSATSTAVSVLLLAVSSMLALCQ